MYYLVYSRNMGISQAPRFTKQFKETLRLVFWWFVVVMGLLAVWGFTVYT